MILKDIRVLDFGRYIAGPYCGSMLADLGAEVIRIERIEGGEDRYVLPVTEQLDGTMFMHVNRNKQGMTLNPMKPEGRTVVRRLVETADVVIANVPQEALLAMGLDYDTLVGYRKDIILVSPSAFGSDGPYAKRTGFDAVAQAMCGAVKLSGTPKNPSKSSVQWVDFATGMYSAYATLAALMHKERTGKGQVVKTSLFHSALSLSHAFTMEQAINQPHRVASGNRSQLAGPSDLFQTRDGHIMLSVVGRPLFERWARLLGEEHWLSDPRFLTDEYRGENGELLSQRMQRWCAQFTSDEALRRLEEARIPAGPVLSPQQLLDDPHVQQAEMFSWMDYPGVAGQVPMMKAPYAFSELDTSIRQRPPSLGEHTDQILKSIGYSENDIKALREKRVV